MSNVRIFAAVAAVLAGCAFAAAPARAESVMKECGTEWKAAKEAKTTNGQSWSEFLKACRERHAAAAPSAPAPSPTPMAAPSPTPTPTMTKAAKPAPAPTHMAAPPTGAGQFATEGEAKGRCPTDTVVWVNVKSKVYHYSGDRYYGTTKHGAYMCEGDAKADGDTASKMKIKSKT